MTSSSSSWDLRLEATADAHNFSDNNNSRSSSRSDGGGSRLHLDISHRVAEVLLDLTAATRTVSRHLYLHHREYLSGLSLCWLRLFHLEDTVSVAVVIPKDTSSDSDLTLNSQFVCTFALEDYTS